ncbi:hypothetical protein [Streptomyces sp. SJL17-1]|uniref:hypothetical protein n=1 Tax=Streptomyces sp. SJL17-1 TaxID=2967223 RepID=UPI0029669D29|nr:hypothetical protein [Streptomyces sp. SJL17-1]
MTPLGFTVTRLSGPEQAWTVSRYRVNYRSALDTVKGQGVQRYEDAGTDVGKSGNRSSRARGRRVLMVPTAARTVWVRRRAARTSP